MKNNKGITLVALVITIIILIILAGITVASLTGDNGLFTRAKNAGEYENSQRVVENSALTSYNSALDPYFDGTNVKTN